MKGTRDKNTHESAHQRVLDHNQRIEDQINLSIYGITSNEQSGDLKCVSSVESRENEHVGDLSVVCNEKRGQNEPRLKEERMAKCPYSPYLYHRFVKQERQNHENGSKSTILRCRYCALLVQVWVGYREDKEGRMIAYRETNIVEDESL